MPMILDFGSGRSPTPGAIGIDNVLLDTVNLVCDLAQRPYPLASACADEIIFSHVLEHFEFPEIVQILNEAHRLLKPGGIVTISVPHAYSIAAFAPQHRTYFMFEYFEMFDPSHPFGYYADYSKRWKVVRRWASVNLVNDHYLPKLSRNAIVQKIEFFIGKVISRFARRNDVFNLADLLVKYLPLWLVSIHWKIQKPPDPE